MSSLEFVDISVPSVTGDLVINAVATENELVSASIHSDGTVGIKTDTKLDSSGNEVTTAANGWYCTGLIPVKEGYRYHFSPGLSMSNSIDNRISLYDTDMNAVNEPTVKPRQLTSRMDGVGSLFDRVYLNDAVIENDKLVECTFVCFNKANSSGDGVIDRFENSSTMSRLGYIAISDVYDDSNPPTMGVVPARNTLNEIEWTDDCRLNSGGKAVSFSGLSVSDYISIKPGDIICWYDNGPSITLNWTNTSGTAINGSTNSNICLYNSDKTLLNSCWAGYISSVYLESVSPSISTFYYSLIDEESDDHTNRAIEENCYDVSAGTPNRLLAVQLKTGLSEDKQPAYFRFATPKDHKTDGACFVRTPNGEAVITS